MVLELAERLKRSPRAETGRPGGAGSRMPNEALLMELADHGSPERLAKCIHQQLADFAPPVPVERVAAEVGIEEICGEDASFESMLIADAGKRRGIIVYNRRGTVERHRFTIAHELGHFLISNAKQHARKRPSVCMAPHAIVA
jgi:hypothetical protein